jgi:predicted metal-dependent HD superfamily phosphohydrolase
MIKEEFLNAISAFNSTASDASKLWQEIAKQYGDASRHYHTLTHLENLINELLPLKSSFRNWQVVVFAIAYHDIIYKASKNNNEEKSAELAGKSLTDVGVPAELVTRCKNFIIATKRHEPVDGEIDLFTDADLSILGSAPDAYLLYTKQIRKEYFIYPDLLYKSGRKKVLLHFLGMVHIFKSKFFRDKYEVAARRNLNNELACL